MPTNTYSLKLFRGVDQHLLDALANSGIRYSFQLLRACQTEEQKLSLVERLCISPAHLTDLLYCVDLVQLRSVGGDHARLLLAAGVRNCADLACQSPETLTLTLKQVHEQHRIGYHAPTCIQVRSWIAQAQTLVVQKGEGEMVMVR